MSWLTIRLAGMQDCQGMARVQVNSYRTAYGKFFPREFLDSVTVEEQASDWQGWQLTYPSDILLVAEHGDETSQTEVAGYILARSQQDIYLDYQSEILAIHLLTAYKGRGIGRALMYQAVSALIMKKCQSMMLWTLRENPVRSWYEKLEGQRIGEKRYVWGDKDLEEVAYGWKDLQALLVLLQGPIKIEQEIRVGK